MRPYGEYLRTGQYHSGIYDGSHYCPYLQCSCGGDEYGSFRHNHIPVDFAYEEHGSDLIIVVLFRE